MTEETHAQPFPAEERPEIAVEPLDEPLTEVDCRELKWRPIVPELGQQALVGEYWAPTWSIHTVRDLRAVRSATVHGIGCTEIEVLEWDRKAGWKLANLLYGRVQPNSVDWIAAIDVGKQTLVQTFLEEGFEWAFPKLPRVLQANGLFEALADGSIRSKKPHDEVVYSEAGCALVRLGDRAFRCVRVIGLGAEVESWHCGVTDTYVADNGRTVLTRVYCYAGMEGFPTDPSCTITVDGVRFEHWYDSITDTALGLDLQR